MESVLAASRIDMVLRGGQPLSRDHKQGMEVRHTKDLLEIG